MLKKMARKKRISSTPVFVAGKAAPAYYIAKFMSPSSSSLIRIMLMCHGADLRLIVNFAQGINADSDLKDLLSLYFLPGSVSLAEVLVPASDISQHISTAVSDASGTSNMKYCARDGRCVLMECSAMCAD
ncbi:hypothetical protein B0H17DRAFT_1213301 [Mycena rosella]|uniref:Alpha-1,4 glucan phosphorylase n=1 Tax=Mycena rosella TaxID=1033263 RepID=A0AAD7CR31_MYCRO|nr:hypothetical protein B0H17DRAFT_1213301 [Mycena rosella]